MSLISTLIASDRAIDDTSSRRKNKAASESCSIQFLLHFAWKSSDPSFSYIDQLQLKKLSRCHIVYHIFRFIFSGIKSASLAYSTICYPLKVSISFVCTFFKSSQLPYSILTRIFRSTVQHRVKLKIKLDLVKTLQFLCSVGYVEIHHIPYYKRFMSCQKMDKSGVLWLSCMMW